MCVSHPFRTSPQRLLLVSLLIWGHMMLSNSDAMTRTDEIQRLDGEPSGQEPILPEGAIWKFGNEPDANGIYRLAYSSNGKLLATRNRKNVISIFDVRARKLLCEIDGHDNNWVETIDFSPDSRFFVTAAGPGEKVKIWQAQTGKLEAEIKTDGYAAYFNRNGSSIQVLAETHVETYSWPGVQLTAQRKWKNGADVRAGMSRDGRIVVTYQTINRQIQRTQVIDLETKSKIQLDGPTEIPKSVAISPNRIWIAVAYHRDEKIQLWDLRDPHQKKYVLAKHDETVQSLCFSADSRFLVSSGWDEKVIVWDILTRQPIAQFMGHTEHVNATAFSPLDMTFASGASGTSDTSTIVWDLKQSLPQPETVKAALDYDQVWNSLGAQSLPDSLLATTQFMAGGNEFLDLLEERVGQMLDAKTSGSTDESIKLLDHPEWEVREKATLQLVAMRGQMDTELRLALDAASSPEIKARLSRILREKFTKPETNLVDLRRWSRIVFALERLNTPRTQKILQDIATASVDLDISLDAKEAFERNQRRNQLQ